MHFLLKRNFHLDIAFESTHMQQTKKQSVIDCKSLCTINPHQSKNLAQKQMLLLMDQAWSTTPFAQRGLANIDGNTSRLYIGLTHTIFLAGTMEWSTLPFVCSVARIARKSTCSLPPFATRFNFEEEEKMAQQFNPPEM